MLGRLRRPARRSAPHLLERTWHRRHRRGRRTAARRACRQRRRRPTLCRRCLLAGGDDYELLFAARPATVPRSMPGPSPPLHRIGELTPATRAPAAARTDGGTGGPGRIRLRSLRLRPDPAHLETTMRPTARLLMSHPAHFISLGFGAGLSPWARARSAPCSGGALSADPHPGFGVRLPRPARQLLPRRRARRRTHRQALGVPDHGGIVWDEMVAIWLVLLFTPPGPLWQAVAVHCSASSTSSSRHRCAGRPQLRRRLPGHVRRPRRRRICPAGARGAGPPAGN